MKVQYKALVAAVVLAATLPAQAAIDTSASGNGSLILSVFDRVANISATFDLGKNYSDFNKSGASFANSGVDAAGTSFSWDLAGNADYAPAWNQFLAAASLANIQWAVGAGDNLGAGAGNRGFITTYSNVGTVIQSTQVQGQAGFFDVYTNENTGPAALFQNHTTVANGSSVANTAPGYAGQFYNQGKPNAVGPTAVAALGTDLGVVQFATNTSSFTPAVVTVFGNGAKFNLASNGALVYSTIAAVPEADTWAMMLLGLGFMGFIARRKSV